MRLIAAMDCKRGIGWRGRLPWYFKEDLKRFKELTASGICIMGGTTYDEIYHGLKKPLPGRVSIVLTNKPRVVPQGEIVCFVNSIAPILKLKESIFKDAWVIGGESIYKLFMPYITSAFITEIQDEWRCDTFLPDIPDHVKIYKKIMNCEGEFIDA